jgi:23S rRNA pseudouridine2605 synthase
MTNKPFQKFIQQKETGSKKKERIRQEKKKVRQETKEYFEQKKRERFEGQDTRQKGQQAEHTPQEPTYKGQDTRHKDQKAEHKAVHKDSFRETGGKKLEVKGPKSAAQKSKPISRVSNPASRNTNPKGGKPRPTGSSGQAKTTPQGAPRTPDKPHSSIMPLNKFIAHAGICSRRDAVDIIKSGKVLVNQQVVKEPGFKVSKQDEVKVNGKQITARITMVYILLNKPKDFLTTTDDPEGRRTVMDIVRNATTERVYPIGRLDRNTTGVLLLTNDGELAQKLSHPSYQVKKIYEVKLDKPLSKKDFESISAGITLEDGFVSPDALAYADPKDKSVIGIEIHSGRNRIVRRIFEALGYDVRNLDRVMYASLTKKNVDRGKWRFLSEKEVRLLKYLNASYTRK